MTSTVLSLQRAKNCLQSCHLSEKRTGRIEQRRLQLECARTELVSMLPVEGTSGRAVIEQRIELLERAIEDPTFEERYMHLNMEVLGWRDEQGFPKLVPFLLTDPMFSIEATAENWGALGEKWRTSVTPLLPQPMANMYDDILTKFQRECRDEARLQKFSQHMRWQRRIATRFTGVIPQWVRERIRQASPDFTVLTPRVETEKFGWFSKREVTKTDVSTNIYLIAEVDEWETSKEVVQLPDPLVVGYKAGCLWFICSFDETPLEKYVRLGFTD